MSIVVSRL